MCSSVSSRYPVWNTSTYSQQKRKPAEKREKPAPHQEVPYRAGIQKAESGKKENTKSRLCSGVETARITGFHIQGKFIGLDRFFHDVRLLSARICKTLLIIIIKPQFTTKSGKRGGKRERRGRFGRILPEEPRKYRRLFFTDPIDGDRMPRMGRDKYCGRCRRQTPAARRARAGGYRPPPWSPSYGDSVRAVGDEVEVGDLEVADRLEEGVDRAVPSPATSYLVSI